MRSKTIICPLLFTGSLFRKDSPNFKNLRYLPFMLTNVSRTSRIWPVTAAIPNRTQNFMWLLSNNHFSTSSTISFVSTATFHPWKDSSFSSHNFYSKCESSKLSCSKIAVSISRQLFSSDYAPLLKWDVLIWLTEWPWSIYQKAEKLSGFKIKNTLPKYLQFFRLIESSHVAYGTYPVTILTK